MNNFVTLNIFQLGLILLFCNEGNSYSPGMSIKRFSSSEDKRDFQAYYQEHLVVANETHALISLDKLIAALGVGKLTQKPGCPQGMVATSTTATTIGSNIILNCTVINSVRLPSTTSSALIDKIMTSLPTTLKTTSSTSTTSTTTSAPSTTKTSTLPPSTTKMTTSNQKIQPPIVGATPAKISTTQSTTTQTTSTTTTSLKTTTKPSETTTKNLLSLIFSSTQTTTTSTKTPEATSSTTMPTPDPRMHQMLCPFFRNSGNRPSSWTILHAVLLIAPLILILV